MNFKKVISAVCFLIAVVFSTAVNGQINYTDINVDELSDTQVRQLILRAESVGYNDAQIEQMAAAQGMPPSEILKLSTRIRKIRGKNNFNGQDEIGGRSYEATDVGEPIANNDVVKDTDSAGNIIPRIFGSELFKNNSITFEPNLRIATPKNYIIGPDDQLLIDLSGDNEASYKLQVSPEGAITLQYVGRISVGGLSVEQAISKIRSAMASTYPGLRSGKTIVSVTIGNIRSIKITLLGEVVKPGTYTLSSLSTVFNALNASGGPNDNGSFRNIQVIRSNKIIAKIDVYSFLLKGMQTGNIRLQDQDIINIPVYQTRVVLSGEVKRPAIFEVLNTESLTDVINFGGGFSNKAYTAKIKVLQNTNKERRITDVNADDFDRYNPLNGDRYIVEPILDRYANRVEIVGAVFRPGEFELESGLTLRQLILKADGLKEDAFLNRGYISRLNPDNSMALLSFDVSKVMNGTANDIVLSREDKITISSIFDLREEYKLDIRGEVRLPGSYNYAEGTTIESLVQMAGGFKEGATPDRIEIARRLKDYDTSSKSAKTAEIINVNIPRDLKLLDSTVILQPFDIVSIRSSENYTVQQQVRIEGEVLFPGLYTISRKDERISDLIKRAGGLTLTSFAEGASLKRPGSNSKNLALDKNAINENDEAKQKLANLKRLQIGLGSADTSQLGTEIKSVESDLVGIDLIRILKKPASRYDLFLEDGDVIRVPKQLQTVKVTGEVLKPINVIFSKNKTLRQYVNNAGGFTVSALKKGTYVQYANGSVDAGSKFLFFNNFPKIKPGAEIFVPKKEKRREIGIQAWVGLGTAVASMAAIIVSLLR